MTLHAGATFVIAKTLNPDQNIYTVLQSLKINILFSVPVMLKRLLNHLDETPETSHLRLIVSAGENLPASLYRTLQKDLDVEVLDGIGATEILSTFVSNRRGGSKAGSTGQVVPGFSVKLLNESGEVCQIGEVGNMWVKGITLAHGYIDDSKLSNDSFKNGWFNTQDMFFMDAQQHFHYVGRSSSVVKINGCWFSPTVLEQVLSTHPGVVESAVVFFKDEFGLFRPKAFVKVAAPEIDRDELWRELKHFSCRQLGKDHYPHLFAEIDNLPRTSSGKLLRGALSTL
jgi:acyl-coenzyme A synthetase/AMP-(fatty) acid ligase